jgi:hypothetical protein
MMLVKSCVVVERDIGYIVGDGEICRLLRPNYRQWQNIPIVARKPWKQAGAQERGLARAGCAENDKEPRWRGLAEAAQLIERVDAIGPSRPKKMLASSTSSARRLQIRRASLRSARRKIAHRFARG